jgi:hypothetical protein
MKYILKAIKITFKMLLSFTEPKPSWVNHLLFSNKTNSQNNSHLPFEVIKVQGRDINFNKITTITILSNSIRFVRIEENHMKNNMKTVFAANYFLITINPNLNMCCVLEDGEEIWVEKMENVALGALHIYPPDKIELFDRLIKCAEESGLKPLLGYVANIS